SVDAPRKTGEDRARILFRDRARQVLSRAGVDLSLRILESGQAWPAPPGSRRRRQRRADRRLSEPQASLRFLRRLQAGCVRGLVILEHWRIEHVATTFSRLDR